MAVDDRRYLSKHLRFAIDSSKLTDDMVHRFYQDSRLGTFMGITSKDDRLVDCYAVRTDGKKFELKKGAVSLAKKLGCDSSALTMVHVSRTEVMPDKFIQRLMLDPEQADDMIKYAMGRFTKEMIKAKIYQTIKQEKNKVLATTVKTVGAINAAREGIISYKDVGAAEKFVVKEKQEDEKTKRHEKDIVRGGSFKFTCFRTDKDYYIVSHKGDGTGSRTIVTTPDERGFPVYSVSRDNDPNRFVKKKHYFFYSKRPGYGKTTFSEDLKNNFNASYITDLNNPTGVSKDSQFLIVDEYGGTTRKFNMEDLKGLTSGNASAYTGNRKSYGESFKPRPDVQLILLSNEHLFSCMGDYMGQNKPRQISLGNANLLRDRFHIHRLDESSDDEFTDSERHTALTQRPPFEFVQKKSKKRRRRAFDSDDDGKGPPRSIFRGSSSDEVESKEVDFEDPYQGYT